MNRNEKATKSNPAERSAPSSSRKRKAADELVVDAEEGEVMDVTTKKDRESVNEQGNDDDDDDDDDEEQTKDAASTERLAETSAQTVDAAVPPATTTTTNLPKGAPPLDKGAFARDFFGQPYFYAGKQDRADSYKIEREEAFKDLTVQDLLLKAKDTGELSDLLHETGLSTTGVRPYWDEVRTVPEDRLNGCFIVPRTEQEDEVLNLLYIKELTRFGMRYETFNGLDVRTYDIHLVLGSSGSGKTTLAVNHLASREAMSKHAKDSGGKYFVVYRMIFDHSFTIDGIIDEIRRAVNEKSGIDIPVIYPLKMSVCLILDEASWLKGKLDTKATLSKLLGKLKKKVAVSARLIVAGTGYDTHVAAVDSRNDVYKYYMKPWGPASVRGLVRLLVDVDKMQATVMNCLKRYPILSRLCSNPRIAVNLFRKREPNDFMALYDRSDLTILAYLIQDVATKFMSQNGLKLLNTQSKRIVARAVFAQLDLSRTEVDTEPTYAELLESDTGLINVARSLVDQNYETRNGNIVRLNRLEPPITVSPALTAVLYFMIGASARALGGWKTLETIGALSCLRRGVIAETDLDRLEEYRLVKLHSAVPGTASTSNFHIPDLAGSAVWVNGERAPFADFCTLGELGQSKYVTKPTTPAKIDLFVECEKMGLVKSATISDKTRLPALRLREGLLKALRYIWRPVQQMRRREQERLLQQKQQKQLQQEEEEEGEVLQQEQQQERQLQMLQQQQDKQLLLQQQQLGGVNVDAEAAMEIRPAVNRVLYPEDQLLGPETEPIPLVECSVDDTQLRVGKEILAVQESDVGAWDVLFVTNSVCFTVTLGSCEDKEAKKKNKEAKMRAKSAKSEDEVAKSNDEVAKSNDEVAKSEDEIVKSINISITRSDVNASGELNNQDLSNWATKYLKEDVKLFFLFAVEAFSG